MHNPEQVPYSALRRHLIEAFTRHRYTAPKAGIWTLVLERDIFSICDKAAELARNSDDKGN